jgi:FkbM family methyltransferase
MAEAPDARFLAFEPLPFLYDRLVHNFDYPNVKVFDLALSDSKGLITFNYVVTNPSYSGLRKRRYDRKDERDQAIEVKTDTLDHVLEAEAIRKVTLIKLDVEGAEYLVLKGAKNTVLKHKPVIIFEHGMGGSDCYERGPEDLYRLLVEESGLRISLLPDYLLGRMPLTAEEFSNQFHQGLNFYFVAHP